MRGSLRFLRLGAAFGVAFTIGGEAAVSMLQHRVLPLRMTAQPASCASSTSSQQGPPLRAVAKTVELASTMHSPHCPTTIFIHGLDSSKETWKGILAEMAKQGLPALAFDLRGHGESPLGAPEDFSTDALASDVIAAAEAHGVRAPYVVVGHSMGGVVAMQLAAIDAQRVQNGEAALLSACIVEDMDVSKRAPAAKLSQDRSESLERFAQARGRLFRSWEECRAALLPWYSTTGSKASARVDSWRESRVRALSDGSGWWSDINPLAMRLARDHVLASGDGKSAWEVLSSHAADAGGKLHFALHVWVAGEAGTVCKWEGDGGIEDMRRRLPYTRVRLFEDAGHSIHNSARAEFMHALRGVLADAASVAARSADTAREDAISADRDQNGNHARRQRARAG